MSDATAFFVATVDNHTGRRLSDLIKVNGVKLPLVLCPTALISCNMSRGAGAVVCPDIVVFDGFASGGAIVTKDIGLLWRDCSPAGRTISLVG